MPYNQMAYDRLQGIDFPRMREYRLKRTKEMMEKHGIGTLVTFDAVNIRYITGVYVTVPCRWVEQQFVVLPRNGDPHCFVSTSFSPYKMREELPWLKGKIWPSLGLTKMKNTLPEIQHYIDRIAGIVSEHGLSSEPIGIDGCSSELLFHEGFKRAGLEMVDAKAVMFDAKLIKNEDEISCIRMACTMAEAAFDEMRRALRPGIKECELMGIGIKRLYELGADSTEEFVVASGPRTNPLHIDFTDRIIRPGDLVAIDVNGNTYMGYKSCYYRTFSCGKATQEQKDCYQECKDMLYAAMSKVKAGNTTGDITAAWPSTPKYWGYDSWNDTFGYACGHGLGLSLHEYPDIIKPLSDEHPTKLEEGMVIALEVWTGKRGGDFGVRLEENLVVRKDGYELLTKYPLELIECGI